MIKPNPENCKNCSCKCAYNCILLRCGIYQLLYLKFLCEELHSQREQPRENLPEQKMKYNATEPTVSIVGAISAESWHATKRCCNALGIPKINEKCWAHSPLRAAARRTAIHQVSLLSHAACASRRHPVCTYFRVTRHNKIGTVSLPASSK